MERSRTEVYVVRHLTAVLIEAMIHSDAFLLKLHLLLYEAINVLYECLQLFVKIGETSSRAKLGGGYSNPRYRLLSLSILTNTCSEQGTDMKRRKPAIMNVYMW